MFNYTGFRIKIAHILPSIITLAGVPELSVFAKTVSDAAGFLVGGTATVNGKILFSLRSVFVKECTPIWDGNLLSHSGKWYV